VRPPSTLAVKLCCSETRACSFVLSVLFSGSEGNRATRGQRPSRRTASRLPHWVRHVSPACRVPRGDGRSARQGAYIYSSLYIERHIYNTCIPWGRAPVSYLTGSDRFRQPVASRAAMAALLDKVHTNIGLSICNAIYIIHIYRGGGLLSPTSLGQTRFASLSRHARRWPHC